MVPHLSATTRRLPSRVSSEESVSESVGFVFCAPLAAGRPSASSSCRMLRMTWVVKDSIDDNMGKNCHRNSRQWVPYMDPAWKTDSELMTADIKISERESKSVNSKIKFLSTFVCLDFFCS